MLCSLISCDLTVMHATCIKLHMQILSVEDLVREARQIASSGPSDWCLRQTKTSRSNDAFYSVLAVNSEQQSRSMFYYLCG